MRGLEKISSLVSWRSAILVSLVASLFVPVIVPSGFFFPYVVPRNLFFRVVVELGIAALIWALCFDRKKIDLRGERILWALVAFVAAAALSALFSPARSHSLFGDFERMGGVWAWLHLVLFFLLLRTLRDEDWGWILNAALAVSLFVSADAIVSHVQVASTSPNAGALVIGTPSMLGNPGLLAAYLLLCLGIAAYLATTSVRFRLLYLAAGAVDLLALVYAENRSTVIGLILGATTAGLILATLGAKSRRRWIAPALAVVFACGIAATAAEIRAHPASALARKAPRVLERLAMTGLVADDEARTMQWRAAIEGFQDRPLVGYGLENHNLAWSAHLDPGIYHTATDVFDRTHNQFLEMLATTGIVGTLAFLAIWVAIVVASFHAYRSGRLSASAVAVLVGLQVAYATYLFFWFVDLNSTMLWILFAALIASRARPTSIIGDAPVASAKRAGIRLAAALASVTVLVVALWSDAYAPLRANRALSRIDSRDGSLEGTLADLDVVSTSPAHQTAHTPFVMSQFMGSVAPRLKEIEASPVQRRMLDRAFGESISAFAREIHRDTLNDRLYSHEGSLLMEAARFYKSPSYRRRAIDAFHKAIELSAHRMQPRLLLAGVYTGERDFERASVVLADAVKNDPGLGEPRYRLAAAYLGAGQRDSALTMLRSSLELGYVGSPETYLAMGKRLELSGRSTEAAKLYSDYLEAKYSKAVWCIAFRKL